MTLIYQSCDKLQFDEGEEIFAELGKCTQDEVFAELDCYAADAVVEAPIIELIVMKPKFK